MIFVFWANFFSFLLKEFQHECQNRIPHVHWKPWKKINFFEKIVGVLTVFTSERKTFSDFFFNFGNFSTFCRHLFRGPSKLPSSSPEKHFKDKQVFTEHLFFLSSLDLPRKLSSLLAKVFIGRDMTIAINASIATICGEILFWKGFHTFWPLRTSSGNSRPSGKNYMAGLWKLLPRFS